MVITSMRGPAGGRQTAAANPRLHVIPKTKGFYGAFFFLQYGAVRFDRTAPQRTISPLTKPHHTAPYDFRKKNPHQTTP